MRNKTEFIEADTMLDAYLDIETTGLSRIFNEITVIGLYLAGRTEDSLVQLVGGEVTKENLMEALKGVNTIYTYNGSRFDLPFIYSYLRVDLSDYFYHHDLMYDCWRNNLYGGYKTVEKCLGIPRKTIGISGFEAVTLWHTYQRDGYLKALALLLEYNKEDVVNLKTLRDRFLIRGTSK